MQFSFHMQKQNPESLGTPHTSHCRQNTRENLNATFLESFTYLKKKKLLMWFDYEVILWYKIISYK